MKREKIIQSYSSEGLAMVDMEKFISGIKASWLKRLLQSKAAWTRLAGHSIGVNVDTWVRYGAKKLTQLRKTIRNPFWSDVVHAWSEFVKRYVPSIEEVLSENIWFSGFTNFSTTVIKCWDKAGLRFIADLFCYPEGRFYTMQELGSQHRLNMSFLEYEGLTRSIPLYIKEGVAAHRVKPALPLFPYRIHMIVNGSPIGKLVYLQQTD